MNWVGDREYEVPVTGNSSEEPVTGNGCSTDCDLERRLKVRMAEAQDAAQVALAVLRHRASRSDLDSADAGRLARTAFAHEQLAEALREVLEGGF